LPANKVSIAARGSVVTVTFWLLCGRSNEKVQIMKNVFIGILLVVSVALGGMLIATNRKLAQAGADRATLLDKVDNLQAQADEKNDEVASLTERLEAAQKESVANAGTAAKLSVALTNTVESAAAGETNAKPANAFAEMFKNKEMRDMIKEQQKTVLGTMVDKNYAEFFKSMNLTPEQTAAMKDLILNKMLSGAEMGMEMMGSEMTTEQRAEMVKKMKEAGETINQQLKDLLGAENYSQYETYEKSIPDRMALEQFKGQLTADLALNAGQEQSLLDAISAERQGFKFTTDFSNQEDFSEDMFSRFTEERMNLFFQEQDQLSQRYLDRARTILSPDQYNTYAKSLKTQQDMMKMGLKMASQMFGTKK
jgi:hypothetical protein